MISSVAFAFVVAPCIGAVVAAVLLRDWRLAAAAACGALALLLIGRFLPEAMRLFGLPFVFGVLIGAIALVPLLAKRPHVDAWSRMITALVATFTITFLHLLITTNGA